MEKILEKSGNFVSPEKWEPWFWRFCAHLQSQSRPEERDGSVQEEGAGRSTAGTQNQRQLRVRIHRGPERETTVSGDLTG